MAPHSQRTRAENQNQGGGVEESDDEADGTGTDQRLSVISDDRPSFSV